MLVVFFLTSFSFLLGMTSALVLLTVLLFVTASAV